MVTLVNKENEEKNETINPANIQAEIDKVKKPAPKLNMTNEVNPAVKDEKAPSTSQFKEVLGEDLEVSDIVLIGKSNYHRVIENGENTGAMRNVQSGNFVNINKTKKYQVKK